MKCSLKDGFKEEFRNGFIHRSVLNWLKTDLDLKLQNFTDIHFFYVIFQSKILSNFTGFQKIKSRKLRLKILKVYFSQI
jgi:hypothetical protein